MAYSIPEAVPLLWGYVVWVKEVTTDDPALEGEHAIWDVTTRTIYLDRTKPIAERRWTLMHELEHGWADCRLWAAQNSNVKVPEAYDQHEPPEEEDAPPGTTRHRRGEDTDSTGTAED